MSLWHRRCFNPPPFLFHHRYDKIFIISRANIILIFWRASWIWIHFFWHLIFAVKTQEDEIKLILHSLKPNLWWVLFTISFDNLTTFLKFEYLLCFPRKAFCIFIITKLFRYLHEICYFIFILLTLLLKIERLLLVIFFK